MQAYRIALLLVAFSTVAATAQEGGLDKYRINFSLQEIRDPQMNNELAATIAVPVGWKFKDSNIVQWNGGENRLAPVNLHGSSSLNPWFLAYQAIGLLISPYFAPCCIWLSGPSWRTL